MFKVAKLFILLNIRFIMRFSDWEVLDEVKQKEIAKKLLNSERGIYLLSKALSLSIIVLEDDRENNNGEDFDEMKILRDSLFPVWWYLNMGKEDFYKLKKGVDDGNN